MEKVGMKWTKNFKRKYIWQEIVAHILPIVKKAQNF
jgi:hypothetical protein